jgi:DNA polymerase zeta
MRVRLDNIDHALERPGPLDESSLPKVPVIRIYGLSSTGQRACLHVHQVYPYFFVDYSGSLNPDKGGVYISHLANGLQTYLTVKSYICKLTKSLNHAIAFSLHRNPHGPNAQYIRAIILVKGVPFYGFHTFYQPFLKILVADPTYVSRTVTILQSGGIMRTRFTTYESHLSYYLQFMCDFSLYGCGWVDLGEVFLRGDNQDPSDIPGSESLPTSPYFKQSRLSLELDVCSHQILNRHDLEPRDIHSTLRISAPSLSPDPLIQSVRELWEDERRRRIANRLSPSPKMPKLLSEHKRDKGGEWVDLERLQTLLFDKCNREENEGKTYRERNRSWEKWVMSTFESVEALWDSERRTWRPKRDGKDGLDKMTTSKPENWSLMTVDDSENNVGELDVDESMLSSQEIDILVEEQTALQDRDEDEEGEDDEHGYAFDVDYASFTHLVFRVDFGTEDEPSPEHQLSGGRSSAQIDHHILKVGIHRPTGRACHELSSSTPFPESSPRVHDEEQSMQARHGVLTVVDKKTHPAFPDIVPPPLTQPVNPQSGLAPVLDEVLHTAILDDDPTTTLTVDLGLEYSKSEIGSFPASSSARTESPEDSDQPAAKRRKLEQCSTSSSFTESKISSQQVSHSDLQLGTRGFAYIRSPPRANALLDGILLKEYCDPFYSISEDLPERPREYAGLLFDLTRGSGTAFLPTWTGDDQTAKMDPLQSDDIGGWEYARWPPSRKRVVAWLEKEQQMGVGKKAGDDHDEKKPKRRPHVSRKLCGAGRLTDDSTDRWSDSN